MSPRTAYATIKANLPVILAACALLASLGILANPVRALENRVTTLEQAMSEVRRWARASAIDLCLSRPDSVLARMDLDCPALLHRR